MTDNYAVGFIILALILGIASRFLLARLMHVSKLSVRLGIIVGLFLLYTAGLMLLLMQTYLYVLEVGGSIQYYHQAVMLTIVIANTVVLFIGILSYAACGKHRLSNTNKMRLMDL